MSKIQLMKKTAKVAVLNKKEMVLTRNVRYSKISTQDLIYYASENSGISHASIAAVLYAIEQQIRQFIFNGHSLELGTLGTFYISTRAHAVEDEKDAGADAIYRLSVQFRQSKELRNLVNGNIQFASDLMNEGSDSGTSTNSNTGGGNNTGDSNNTGGGTNTGGGNDNQGGDDDDTPTINEP